MNDTQEKASWEEQYEKTFPHGRKDWKKGLLHAFIRTAIETAIKEERERIAEEVNKLLCEEYSIYGTDKHGLSGEQLKHIINTPR
jgi:hypothetical protein